jgi:hypothetical protein
MRFSSSRDSANRHSNGDSRATVQSVDDTQLMQQVDVRLFYDEQQSGIEHFEPYGFSSVMQPPSLLGSVLQAAEAFFAFLSGNRSHGIAVTIGDRRFRLINKQPGEVALYDDQGQWIYLRRSGIVMKVPPGNSIAVQIDGPGTPAPTSGSGQNASQIPSTVTGFTIAQNLITLTAQTICLASSDIRLGSMEATRPVSAQGTVDTKGGVDDGDFLTSVKGI